ncbi:MAG TPA: BON domain-containing protein [Chloroflexota bacterium]|jgi:osmotically-inducible protein OsmY|nr:BON domain-containing protein [Chloroflexota bacterium]
MEPTDQEIEHGIRVRLSGHALSEQERRWAAEVVRSVSGVTEVLDEIVVLGGPAPPR